MILLLADLTYDEHVALVRRIAQGYGLDYETATHDGLLDVLYDAHQDAEKYRDLCR